MIRAAAVLFALLTSVTASAQWPLFDPDDFLGPRATGGRPVFISRLVIGGASNMSGDGFRPLGENVGYVHLANSFSWRSVQFDYKRSQMKAEGGEAAVWRNTQTQEPIPGSDGAQFGVPALVQQTRNATPKSKDTLGASWYWPVGGGGIPVMLRSRMTFTRQPIATDVVTVFRGGSKAAAFTAGSTQHLSGHERSFALDTDTWFRIAGHDVFGSLAISETKTSGTRADREERALTYTYRMPSLSVSRTKLLIRPTLTVGGISNRGGSAVNLFNPAVEIFRPFARTGANLHVIYSPQFVANGERWRTTHQIALLIDHAVFVKVF
jgi:hypothetical protein